MMTFKTEEKHLDKSDIQRMFRRSLKTGWAWTMNGRCIWVLNI